MLPFRSSSLAMLRASFRYRRPRNSKNWPMGISWNWIVDWLRELGLVIFWSVLGSLGAGLGPAVSTWFCDSDSFFMAGLSHGGLDIYRVTLKKVVAGKRA